MLPLEILALREAGYKSVHELAREMGVELTNRQAWGIGKDAALDYRRDHGTQPIKDNRPKKSGHGSHCFALYPPSWHHIIQRRIRAIMPPPKIQGELRI